MSFHATVSEAEFLAAVEHISGVLAAKYRFGVHDAEDIRQIVCVHSLEALPRFNPSRGNLEAFLYQHCANRLSNARRNELGCRTDPPCRVCYRYAIGEGAGHPDGSTCPKFDKWWARRQTRANLARPFDLNEVASLEQERGMCAESTVESAAEKQELLDLVDAHLPLDLRADYLRMKAGELVPKAHREKVLAAVRDILDNPAQYESRAADTAMQYDEHEDGFDDADDDDE